MSAAIGMCNIGQYTPEQSAATASRTHLFVGTDWSAVVSGISFIEGVQCLAGTPGRQLSQPTDSSHAFVDSQTSLRLRVFRPWHSHNGNTIASIIVRDDLLHVQTASLNNQAGMQETRKHRQQHST